MLLRECAHSVAFGQFLQDDFVTNSAEGRIGEVWRGAWR